MMSSDRFIKDLNENKCSCGFDEGVVWFVNDTDGSDSLPGYSFLKNNHGFGFQNDGDDWLVKATNSDNELVTANYNERTKKWSATS